jgi:hypothetical protein
MGLDEFRKGGRDLLGRLIFEEGDGRGEGAGGVRKGQTDADGSVVDAKESAHAE